MIIDFHGHVGRWDSLDMVDDPAEMLHAMDAVGIDKSWRLQHLPSRRQARQRPDCGFCRPPPRPLHWLCLRVPHLPRHRAARAGTGH